MRNGVIIRDRPQTQVWNECLDAVVGLANDYSVGRVKQIDAHYPGVLGYKWHYTLWQAERIYERHSDKYELRDNMDCGGLCSTRDALVMKLNVWSSGAMETCQQMKVFHCIELMNCRAVVH